MKTIKNYIQEYLNYLCSLNYSAHTTKNARLKLALFEKWLIQTFQVEYLAKLRPEHLKSWHEFIISQRTNKGFPLKVTSINFSIRQIRGFFTYLIRYNYVHQSFMEMLPRLKEPQNLPTSVLNHSQVKKMFAKMFTNNAEGYRNRTMLELMYSTAIRANELLSLDITSIDFKQSTALVRGKGNKERLVPFGVTAGRYLETYLVAIRPYLQRNKQEKALFLNSRGVRVTYEPFRCIIVSAAQQAGYENITAHTFRRSCATELIRNGANMYHVKELLGHESLDTLRHYAKLTINDLKKTHKKCHPREKDVQK
jgi:site-specific recombinase XerD